MHEVPAAPGPEPQMFRPYLRLLAELQLGAHAGTGIDPSDIVQQTLLDAHRDQRKFRGQTESERLAWLRRLLACNLADALRMKHRTKRDVTRERSLESAIEASSARLGALLAADQSSPSETAGRNEEVIRLVDALAKLPQANRLALVMRHCEGLPLSEISTRLKRTPAAVAGLLKRGLAELRTILPPDLD
jgi:RNA polymerase sigma-70 factor, ECF subfamily